MINLPALAERTYASFRDEARALIPTLTPHWTDHNATDPGIILVELLAWLAETVMYRIDRVPERSTRTFLRLLRGSEPTAADGSRLSLDEAIRITLSELRERDRAITTADFEYLALQRWPTVEGVAEQGIPALVRRALCIAEQSPATLLEARQKDGPNAEGHVTLVVVPDSPAASRSELPAFDPGRQFALDLDGAAGYVDCGRDASLAITGALTLSAWIFPRKPSGGQGIVCKSASGEFEFLLEAGGSLRFCQADGLDGGSVAAKVPTGRWSHIAVVRDALAKSARFLVDGRFVGAVTLAKNPIVTEQPLWIGRRSGGGGFFDGFIRDVCVWNRTRTDLEIGSDLRNRPLGIDASPGDASLRPVACWRLDVDTSSGAGFGTTRDAQTPDNALTRARDGALTGASFRNVLRPLEASASLLKGLSEFLDEWRLLTTRVHVIGHRPLPIRVSARLYLRPDGVPRDVRAAVSMALERFVDPLRGWKGAGWPFGRALYHSELSAMFDQVLGVDFVDGVEVSLDDTRDIDHPTRPPDLYGPVSNKIGLALRLHELPVVSSSAFKLFQRTGTQWQPV